MNKAFSIVLLLSTGSILASQHDVNHIPGYSRKAELSRGSQRGSKKAREKRQWTEEEYCEDDKVADEAAELQEFLAEQRVKQERVGQAAAFTQKRQSALNPPSPKKGNTGGSPSKKKKY